MSGIQNFGNTCFVNSVVQILRYVKPVVKELVTVRAKKDFIQDFINLLYQDSKSDNFVHHLKDLGFDPLFQHDAHEFLITMLDKLYENIDNENPFEGVFENTLVCKNGHKSVSKEKYVCLSINGGIEEGLGELQEPETVRCKCDHCSETVMTKHVVVNPGKVVCVHFKRFNIDGKLTYKVPIITKWNGYKLVGMCNHIGSCTGGHYTATVKTGNGWMHMNDEFVEKIDGVPKTSRVPYLMVYVLDK